jgi:Tn3 transposase DDE domain
LQPRYAKKVADADSLMAVIIAQAMNHGNQVMARTSDIPYHVLASTYQQYLRQASLQAANDRISNAIAALPIFPHYSFDLDTLYGAVDGQKFGVERPTVKARYSRKYFGRGKGVVAYTLLCNHVPLNSYLLGAHDYEGHHVFDKLVRSLYTLRYLRDPQLERNVHRSQNRIESYHQLRSAIAQVGGKKELTGRTDIEIEISNQCARLIANAIIYYNSAILSRLLTKHEARANAKALVLITQMSPAAWRHILLNGHYTFQSDGRMIDLDTLVAGLELS